MNFYNLKPTNKILNISHYDFDGVSCAIVLSNYFKNITCECCSFVNIDKTIQKINFNEYDAVIITDCTPKDVSLLKHDKIIVLDHHPAFEEIPNENAFIVTDNCAAVLVKNFVETTFNVDLSYLDNLLKYTNDYDLWIHKHKKSKLINELFWRYGYFGFKGRFQSGNVRFTLDEINFLRSKKKEFIEVYNNLEIFDFDKINACFIVGSAFLNDIAERLLYVDNYEMILIQNPKNKHISLRIKDDVANVGEMLANLRIGGGHPKAGGIDVLYQNLNEMKNDFIRIENYVLEHFPWLKRKS